MDKHLAVVLLMLWHGVAIAAPDSWRATARSLYADVVGIRTVTEKDGAGSLADYLADVFRKAGFPADEILVLPYANTAALRVRLAATGKPAAHPILLLAHMDVVDALDSDWTKPPFRLVEEEGYFYGRGTNDNKGGLVAIVTTLLRLKKEGANLNRDLVLFFTGDEETDGVGAKKMAGEWRHLHDAEFALNSDAGGGDFLAGGKALGFGMQTAEKTYASFILTAQNRGGHSSVPRPDNAIYELAAALTRLRDHRFPPMINETTRATLLSLIPQYPQEVGDAIRVFTSDPSNIAAADRIEREETLIGRTRTTCVATLLSGGHAENALPQAAVATVNCRIFPGVTRDAIRTALAELAGSEIAVEPIPGGTPETDVSPLREDVVQAFTAGVHARFPGVNIVPVMSSGATDGAYLRAAGIPTYGVDGLWGITPDDDRSHGRDERVRVDAFYGNLDHWYIMLTRLAGVKN
ncbi:MAG: M20/M25/M40 family metallo-hydrolase [Gammaproteobacteria bacterium]|nr:M20/M25/M40 family metallo-hydrolase [Gammaproteobacteria bacterium]